MKQWKLLPISILNSSSSQISEVLKIFYPIIFASFFCLKVHAQNVAAYFDYKNYFFVFDKWETKEMEYKEVFSYKVGKDFVAYINADKSLKISKGDFEKPANLSDIELDCDKYDSQIAPDTEENWDDADF